MENTQTSVFLFFRQFKNEKKSNSYFAKSVSFEKKKDFILAAMAMKIDLRLRKSDRIKEQQIDE